VKFGELPALPLEVTLSIREEENPELIGKFLDNENEGNTGTFMAEAIPPSIEPESREEDPRS
jgi:hypothetical protein